MCLGRVVLWEALLPRRWLSLSRGVPVVVAQLLGHLPVFKLSHQLIYRLGMVAGDGSPGLWW